jgi:hypothetical protein
MLLKKCFWNVCKIYYVFGRYPAKTIDKHYPVFDLVMCDGDFLNADHSCVHKNKNLKGFGSYGDIMIRDRKMYVAPTPFALLNGVERQVTLVALDSFSPTKASSLSFFPNWFGWTSYKKFGITISGDRYCYDLGLGTR